MRHATTLVARGLALLWAGFWLFFFVVESLVWHTPAAVMAAWTGAGLFFVVLAVIAWRSERKGGMVVAGVGLLAGLAYAAWSPAGLTLASRVITGITLGVPPVLAGMLFVAHDRAVSARARTMRTPSAPA